MVSVFFLGCENADLQKEYVTENSSINLRADDCENCPVDDCCCYITLNGVSFAELTFCGTTNPELSTSPCSFDLQDPCPDISGYYWSTELNNTDPDEFFCVATGTSFMVGSPSATSLTLTCQYGQVGYQSVNFSLSAGQRRFYTVDNDCELTECHAEP